MEPARAGRRRQASPGEQVQAGGEAVGDLQCLRQLGVADDHHAVGDGGGPPVPPRRADREQFERGDVLAVFGQQRLQAFIVGDPAARRWPA